MKKINYITGFTIIEVILALTILGIVISPLTALFVMSAKINQESNLEYKSILVAQGLMEEILATDELDLNTYILNINTGVYKKTVALQDGYKAEVTVTPKENILYDVKVVIFYNNIEANTLSGTKLLNK